MRKIVDKGFVVIGGACSVKRLENHPIYLLGKYCRNPDFTATPV
jgi:hypothetical protein